MRQFHSFGALIATVKSYGRDGLAKFRQNGATKKFVIVEAARAWNFESRDHVSKRDTSLDQWYDPGKTNL